MADQARAGTRAVRRSAIAAHVALVGWLAAAAPALAAEGEVERTVLIVELRHGPDANSLTSDYMKEIAKLFGTENKGDFILVPIQKAIERLSADRQQVPTALSDERRASLDEARKKGIGYLDNGDTTNAIKALLAAESKYRGAIAAPGADDALRKAYLDVLAQLATAYVVAKDVDSAREVFRNVVTTFGPSAPITDNDYRPDVVKIFQTVVIEMKKMPQGSIDVTSNPLGGRVLVGGIDRGATPTQVASLIPGVYSVRVTQGSTTSLLRRVRVDAGKETKVSIDIAFESHLVLEDASVGLSYRDLEEAKARVGVDALTLGRAMDVNVVAVVGVFDRRLVAFQVDVAGGKVGQTMSNPVPQIGVSQRAVVRVVDTLLGKQAAPAPVESKPWYTSVPGWALGGAGVVALSVGLAYAGSLSGEQLYPCPSNVYLDKPACPAAYGSPAGLKAASDEKSSIEGEQTIAGAGLVVGGLLLAGSAVMFYLHGRSAGEETALLLDGSGRSLLPPSEFGHARTTFVATP